MKDKMICGECNFCIKDDGSPYCVLKDLFTTVDLEQKCYEKDPYGDYWFAHGKKGEK